MKIENIKIDTRATFGELRFFGLSKENFEYNSVTKQRTSVLESRVYKLLSMTQGDMVEVTIPASIKKELIELNNNSAIDIINPTLSASASVITRGNFNSAVINPLLQVDDIIPVTVAKLGK